MLSPRGPRLIRCQCFFWRTRVSTITITGPVNLPLKKGINRGQVDVFVPTGFRLHRFPLQLPGSRFVLPIFLIISFVPLYFSYLPAVHTPPAKPLSPDTVSSRRCPTPSQPSSSPRSFFFLSQVGVIVSLCPVSSGLRCLTFPLTPFCGFQSNLVQISPPPRSSEPVLICSR